MRRRLRAEVQSEGAMGRKGEETENEKCEKIGAREVKVSLRGLADLTLCASVGFVHTAPACASFGSVQAHSFVCVQTTPVHASLQKERKPTRTKCDRVGL